MVSAGLLAYILVSKFDDHLPLYRLNEIFARMGADIPDSTLVDWCGRAMKVLQPLTNRIEAEVMTSDLLHADDTPIRVLDRSQRDMGLGKGVKKGRIWAYVRDPRPWAGTGHHGSDRRYPPSRAPEHSKPKVEAFRAWTEKLLTRILGKGDLAKAFRYGLSRWPSFCLFLEDGRVAIDNNPAERALRPIGIGRKYWLFSGADTGAETLPAP